MSIDIRSGGRDLDENDRTVRDRLLSNFAYDATSGCWNWLGAKNQDGYGLVSYGPGGRAAHRWLYALLVEAIPAELVCDHLCRNTSCINPQHIEIVTHRENILRGVGLAAANAAKTHCKNGHELVGENIYNLPHRRTCKICARARTEASHRRLRGPLKTAR